MRRRRRGQPRKNGGEGAGLAGLPCAHSPPSPPSSVLVPATAAGARPCRTAQVLAVLALMAHVTLIIGCGEIGFGRGYLRLAENGVLHYAPLHAAMLSEGLTKVPGQNPQGAA